MSEKEYEIKECRKHGKVKFIKEGRGYFRCTKCRSESVSKRRRVVKQKAIDYLGGKCSKCGYSKCNAALEFHHKDPTQKDFGIASKGATMSWDKMRVELDKCILVCSNCHREIHDGM